MGSKRILINRGRPTLYEILNPQLKSIKGTWKKHPWKTFCRWMLLKKESKKIININNILFIPTDTLPEEEGLTRHELGEKYIKIYMPLEGKINKSTLLHELGHVVFYRCRNCMHLSNPTKFSCRFGWGDALGSRGYTRDIWREFAEAMADRFVLKHGKRLGLSSSEISKRKSSYMEHKSFFLHMKRNKHSQK